MKVRWAKAHELASFPGDEGPSRRVVVDFGVFDQALTVSELIALRAEIDRFLFEACLEVVLAERERN